MNLPSPIEGRIKMEENFVTLKIDDKEVKVKQGTTILQAAKQAGIDIPTLCFLKEINEVGDCRMCIVEVDGRKGFATSCIQKAEEGMVVHTHSPAVMEARRVILDLILSNHHRDCLTCSRNGNCELQALAMKFNVQHVEFEGEMTEHKVDDKSPAIMRDFNKCILCRRCVAACKNVQEIGAIDCINRGFESCISTVGDHSLNDVNCTFCGQCIEACPTGALKEKEYIKDVWRNLKDPDIYTVVQTAPAVRVALGEEFDMPIGTNVTGKMVSALKSLGFDRVFDTNTGADLTIMEEANEFIERFSKQDCLPMITSCSPGWVRFAEKNYPDLLGHLSSCKSPHQMFGAMVKSYYAKKYITERAGKQHCVELLGVWDNPEDIEWDKLPSAFVLKTVKGHYGRQVILVRDKSKLDIESTIQKLRDFCDLPYMKQIHKKRIIAEELLTPKNGEPLIDYKIYCAHGRPLVAYCLGMPQDQDDCDVSLKTCSFYSLPDWERLPIVSNNHPAIDVQKPRHLNTMLEVARKLSRDFPLVRIDFYQIGDRVLVGEITEDSNGGVAILEPVEWDFRFGNGLYVPSEKEIEKLIERDTKTYNEYVQNDS